MPIPGRRYHHTTTTSRGDCRQKTFGATTAAAATQSKHLRKGVTLCQQIAGLCPTITCRVSSARIAAKLPCSSFCQASYLRFTWQRQIAVLALQRSYHRDRIRQLPDCKTKKNVSGFHVHSSKQQSTTVTTFNDSQRQLTTVNSLTTINNTQPRSTKLNKSQQQSTVVVQ